MYSTRTELRIDGESLAEIDSEADYILFSDDHGVLSEHFTPSEAAMAYYEIASHTHVGERLPSIYRRDENQWVQVR